jgi:NTP pyrophosphatase (non-canonical NTP hydrolase)
VNLSLNEISLKNRARAKRWHGELQTRGWSGGDWSNAMCGEAGEAANVVKKIRRLETSYRDAKAGHDDARTMEQLREALGFELADTILYLDLLAEHYEIDLPKAIRDKFNIVSSNQDFPERLGF